MTELTPLAKRKKTTAELMHSLKTEGWIFEKPIEKIVVVVCILWSVFSVVKFAFSLFI